MRISRKFQIPNIEDFKINLLEWSQQFKHVVWLDSNNQFVNKTPQNHSDYDAILAIGAHSILECNYKNSFSRLKDYHQKTSDYLFGYLGYDLKNDIESLHSTNFDGLQFNDLCFFQPKKLFFIKDTLLEVKYLPSYSDEIDMDLETITAFQPEQKLHTFDDIKIKHRIHKDEYFNKLNKVLAHIHRGDIYEVSFCQEFYAENSEINPVDVYSKLNEISAAPFSTFLRLDQKYLLSASPERFLKRTKNTVISQPIKGTTKRGKNSIEDTILKQNLENDLKERTENIMIVDLVRNDLSRSAIKGSVKVTELCKAHSFKQVHQLISTVISEVSKDTDSITILKSLFPMGSMTEAKKIAAMKIIEELEETKRGLYSGAVGYISPTKDFDFNVVIRSILYNATNKYISYSVGGAITSKSNPENEYEECLIKAKAMRDVLLNSN